VHLQGGEQRSPAPFERQSAFEREQTPPVQRLREQTPPVQRLREQTSPVQGSRESRHRQFRVRERADTASSGFERELTPPVQGSRETDQGLRCTLVGEAALVY